MAIPLAPFVAAGVRYLVKSGMRGLKKHIRNQKEGKRLTEEELDTIKQKALDGVVKKKRESGEVGYFAKQGTSSQNTTRRLMQNSAKEASRGKVSTKKALTGAAALGGAAYMKGRGDGKAEVTERNKTKRKSPPGGQTIQENRRVVSETKLAKGGALKKAPAKAKGLKKLPTEVRNKMGYMYKGGKATKFKPCAGCTSPKTCAKQGCKKKRSK